MLSSSLLAQMYLLQGAQKMFKSRKALLSKV
jgi:hypothetical protein